MDFKRSDEFVAVLGEASQGVRRRVRQALGSGVCTVQRPFVTVATSAESPKPQLITSGDQRIGCLVEGHCFDIPEVRTPLDFWKYVRDCERGSFNLVFWNEHRQEAVIRTDPLGYRSLYYWTAPTANVLVVASSLHLMRRVVSGLRPDRTAFRDNFFFRRFSVTGPYCGT
jgi:hypothetical protein